LRLTDSKFYTVGHDADSLVWKMMIMPNTKNLCTKPYSSSISQVTPSWLIYCAQIKLHFDLISIVLIFINAVVCSFIGIVPI
jgi:hypothetical protein